MNKLKLIILGFMFIFKTQLLYCQDINCNNYVKTYYSNYDEYEEKLENYYTQDSIIIFIGDSTLLNSKVLINGIPKLQVGHLATFAVKFNNGKENPILEVQTPKLNACLSVILDNRYKYLYIGFKDRYFELEYKNTKLTSM